MTLYLFKTTLCSGILLVAYHLLLEREKMLPFNRFYLLFSLLFSFGIPLIHFSVETKMLLQPQVIATISDAGILVNAVPENNLIAPVIPVEKTAFNWWYIAVAIYAAGCGMLLFRFGKNLFQLVTAIRTNELQDYSNAQLVLLNKPTVPHSFSHFIFLNKEDYINGLIQPEVLCHELTHVQQKHLLDILLIELLLALCWFNPVLYFYRKAIRLNHEFLADAAVIKRFDNAPVYQHLLLQTATASIQPFPASSFTYSITKKRFLMMTKNTSLKVVIAKGITVGCLLAAAVFIFSTRTMAQTQQPKTEVHNKDSVVMMEPIPNNIPRAKGWIDASITASPEDAPQDLINEFNAIIDKYKNVPRWVVTFHQRLTATDKQRLEVIYKKMSREQQGNQVILFRAPFKPWPKVVPTTAQFQSFKNPKVYGVWIDEKHVSSSVLQSYSNTDFSHFYISKLYGPAKTGRAYTHQLDLMTNGYYQKYFDEAIADTELKIMFNMKYFKVQGVPRDSVSSK